MAVSYEITRTLPVASIPSVEIIASASDPPPRSQHITTAVLIAHSDHCGASLNPPINGMRRRRDSVVHTNMTSISITLLVIIGAAQLCEGVRSAQRRRDRVSQTQYLPSPSVETLKELAEAMGAAGFEHYTEGKALVKRLIPQNSEPDLDEISHQGVIGKAGVDFPAFPSIPATGFNCKNVPTGYYADLETDCQVFHICDTSRKISFLCPNGTIFSQSHLICDWWFKVDCASAPALYESSAEYYSNEQKKTHKVTQSLSKNSDLQQISDVTNVKENGQPIRKVPFSPTTTERLVRHRQRLQNTAIPPLTNIRATARSYHALYNDNNFHPTQRTLTTNNIDKKRNNLVQLIGNGFGNTPTTRTTLPAYTDSSTYRNTDLSLKEMQVAAESASFTNNNNRQYLQDYNNKNYRPYPVYNPEVTPRASRTKNPHSTLTTLFVHDIRDKHFGSQVTNTFDFTTKRPTLLPYTKSYDNLLNEKHEPYTRPGVHLLKDYLDKEKNKTVLATEKITKATERVDQLHARPFESATKMPTTRTAEYFTQTASSDRFDVYSPNYNQLTTEPTYHERRERLMRKLNIDNVPPTEPTAPGANHDKQFGRRPGLIVPPSLTPKTLHTLAIYYATALDNLSTTMPPLDDEGTTTYTEQSGEIDDRVPVLFSEITRNRYNNLFSQENTERLQEIIFDANSTNELGDDLSVQQSQNPLSTSPQIRELAQVFTHALSAYLQDPIQFRKALSDIRPTHPTFGDMLTTTDESVINTEATTIINEEDEEILGFSDDNKVKPGLAQLRDPKSLNLATVQPRIGETESVTTQEPFTTDSLSSSTRPPFRCCGRISASYTSAATPKDTATTPKAFIDTIASRIKAAENGDVYITTTENSYTVPKYGGFQNNSNSSPYGKDVKPNNSRPINDYTVVTNLPTAWGVGINTYDPTGAPLTNSHYDVFESNKIRSTTTPAPLPSTQDRDSDSTELENEEELQRAHSQSFVTPKLDKNQNIRGHSLVNDIDVNFPSPDLQAPRISEPTTTVTPTTTNENTEELTTVTPPTNDKATNQFQWTNTFENWHSTVVLDPITLNDGLSATGPQEAGVSKLASQTTFVPTQTYPNTATTTADYTGPVYTEQAFSSSQNIELTTPATASEKRSGRLLKTTASPADLTTIEDSVVEKAKEIMNATTTEKLMHVMMKTKSKTVRRLILLLVQTCDDDHNSTAEASKKALLEALMAVSQKDMDDIAKEELDEPTTTTTPDFESNKHTNAHRRMDKLVDTNFRTRQRNSQRSGKSLNVDPSAINALTNPSTSAPTSGTIKIETTTVNTTPSPFTRTTPASKRGVKKYLVKTTLVDNKNVNKEGPKSEARQASPLEQKTPSDTRAIELLKSLYTIAARWG